MNRWIIIIIVMAICRHWSR